MEYLNLKDLRINTMTCCTKIPNCHFNLLDIERYLEIDDCIVGLKGTNLIRGNYKKSKLKNTKENHSVNFDNQLSIIFKIDDIYINTKIFKNGSLHFTGCKDENMIKILIKKIIDSVRGIEKIKRQILLTKDENDVLLDKYNLIYSYNNYRVIGQKINDKEYYIINGKKYIIDEKTKMFISLKDSKKRDILNLSGEHIGSYERSQFNKKFIKHNFTKGEYKIDEKKIDENKIVIDRNDDIKEINYECKPINKDITNEDILNMEININCINVSFDLNMKLNRENLYSMLINDGYMCKYKPDIYPGIRLIYKIPNTIYKNVSKNVLQDNMIDGLCKCSNKCTCNDITFLIFGTGKVLGTNFKNRELIKPICNVFYEYCKRNKIGIIKDN